MGTQDFSSSGFPSADDPSGGSSAAGDQLQRLQPQEAEARGGGPGAYESPYYGAGYVAGGQSIPADEPYRGGIGHGQPAYTYPSQGQLQFGAPAYDRPYRQAAPYWQQYPGLPPSFPAGAPVLPPVAGHGPGYGQWGRSVTPPLSGLQQRSPSRPKSNPFLVALAVFLSLALLGGLVLTVSRQRKRAYPVDDPEALVARIAAEVAEIRDLELLSKPRVEILDRERMRELVLSHWAADAKAAAELKETEQVLKFLQLLPEEYDLLASLTETVASGVRGLYSPQENAIYVVANDRNDRQDAIELKLAIAHEIGHAVVHQHFDLLALEEEVTKTADPEKEMAFTSLVEGDAQLVMVLWAQSHLSGAEFEALLTSQSPEELETTENLPRVIRSFLFFPYEAGLEFVQTLHSSGGWKAVNDAYRSRPASTEQILHPERFAPFDFRGQALTETVQATPGCFTIADDPVGELDLREILGEFLPMEEAVSASDGWAAGALRLEFCAGKKLLRLRVKMDSVPDTTELASAWEKWVPRWKEGKGNYPRPEWQETAKLGGKVTREPRVVEVTLAEDVALLN
jgi:hypothetical protein